MLSSRPEGHAHEEYLVPLDLITDTSVKHIRLSCSLGELGQLAPFMKTVRVEEAGLNTRTPKPWRAPNSKRRWLRRFRLWRERQS